jgi:hypothetical protein
MIAPATAVGFLLAALAIGAALGCFYDFLRPLRPRLTHLADLIFVLGALWSWVYLTFAICGGDSRLGCTLAVLVGGLFWEFTLGRLIRPVFALFWNIFWWPFGKIYYFFQKIYNFLLANLKKWFTMVWTMIRKKSAGTGGVRHVKRKAHQAGGPQDQPRHKSRHRNRGHSVRGGHRGAVRLHRQPPQSI